MKRTKHITIFTLAAFTILTAVTASAEDLVSQSRAALRQLVAQNPPAAKCKSRAAAVLVFPDVVKAGFIFGAQGGKGILFVRGDNPAVATGPWPPPMVCKPAFRSSVTPFS